MPQTSPNCSNSVNPTEISEISEIITSLEDGPRQTPSPGFPRTREEMDSLTETDRQTRPAIPSESHDDREFFKEMRGWLMIVAILAAGSTYSAGLNPPGGVWQDDHEFVAGTLVLHDKFFRRYQAFFYCNAISFLSSLVIIIFLMNKTFYLDPVRIKVLEITMVLDLFSFMAAYAVGSCRRITTSIYVFLIMGAVFVYVISFVRSYALLKRIAEIMPCTRPCIRNNEQHQHQRTNHT